jgi:hypothetical protein
VKFPEGRSEADFTWAVQTYFFKPPASLKTPSSPRERFAVSGPGSARLRSRKCSQHANAWFLLLIVNPMNKNQKTLCVLRAIAVQIVLNRETIIMLIL